MNIYVIDVGTSSMRGILYNEKAEVLMKHQIIQRPSYLGDGRVEEDPADWRDGLMELLKVLADFCSGKNLTPDVISLTAQRSSVIPLTEEGEPLAPAIMWQDKRTIIYEEKLKDSQDIIFAKTGSRINPVFSACKMAWIRENQPELYQKAFKLAVIPDYLMRIMTGGFYTDYTYGSRSLLMNLKSCSWDEELLEIFGVDREKLCELIPPAGTAGRLLPSVASAVGLTTGIPVVSAGGDQQCAALGLGILHNGEVEITTGTGAFLLAGIDAIPDAVKPHVICSASAVPGRYLLESSVLTCCSAFDWFLRSFYPECSPSDYGVINQEVSDAKGSPVIALPYFQGRATPDWNSRAEASFHHVSLSASRGDFARAILEGICHEINVNLSIIRGYTGEIRSVRICGGLTKNPIFAQLEADILREPVSLFSNEEATALGAWIQGAMALGLFADYASAFQASRAGDTSRVYTPDEDTRNFYQKKQEDFEALYRKLY